MGGSLSLTTPSSNRKVEPEGDTVDCAISKMTNNQKSPKRKNLSLAGIEQLNESLQELKEETQNISDINITQYDFQFENLAFEGGGVKGISFLGCIKALEMIKPKLSPGEPWPKRLAGSSAGAVAAAALAIGCTYDDLFDLLMADMQQILIDHPCGLCSLLPNLIRDFGWNPGDRYFEWLGDIIERKTGNRDLTFKQLYDLRGTELCVTATKVNTLDVEYYHTKTTPNVPIRLALRMTVAIPGIFKPVKVRNDMGEVDVFIDGGLLCNYPVHAFDGWWLSMKPEDSFLNKIQPLSQINKLMEKNNRFGSFNKKTIGFLLYSSMEQEVMMSELKSRVGLVISSRPDTKLYKARKDALKRQEESLLEHQVFLNALDRFMKKANQVNKHAVTNQALKKTNCVGSLDDVIDKNELRGALQVAMENSAEKKREKQKNFSGRVLVDEDGDDSDEDDFTEAHLEILFGQGQTVDSIFSILDTDNSGYISYHEMIAFIEKSGINIQEKFQGYNRRDLPELKDFIIGIQDCLLTNTKKIFLEERDIERTIGIDTDYVETTDFELEERDKEFLAEQGYKSTVAFLKHYVYKHNLQKRSPDADLISVGDNDVIDGKPGAITTQPTSEVPAAELGEEKSEGQSPDNVGNNRLIGRLPPLKVGNRGECLNS